MASARRVTLMRPSEKSPLIVRVINLKEMKRKIYTKRSFTSITTTTLGELLAVLNRTS